MSPPRISDPRSSLAAAVLCGVLLSACSGGSAPPAVTAMPSSTPLPGGPGAWLPRIEQMPAAGFILIEPAHPLTAAAAAHNDATLGNRLQGVGLGSTEQERFFRQVGDLAFANGPVDIIATTQQYPSSATAAQAFTAEVVWRKAQAGLVPVSAGALGDQAWVDQETKPSDGVNAVQITVTVRLGNALDAVTVRGRAGATSLDDVELLMRIMLGNQDPRLAPVLPTSTPPPPTAGAPPVSPAASRSGSAVATPPG